MSIINLELLIWVFKMSDDLEAVISPCTNLSQLRTAVEKPEFRQAILDSVEPVEVLLSTIFQWLTLHEFKCLLQLVKRNFNKFGATNIDPLLQYGKVYRQP